MWLRLLFILAIVCIVLAGWIIWVSNTRDAAGPLTKGQWDVIEIDGDLILYDNYVERFRARAELLAVPLAMPSVLWAVLAFRRRSRQALRGFPVMVSKGQS